jgi:predicted unusual protein kinase regulating ubiquinone biosynthesis (AarF/ABC1/UbiB family)
MGSTAARVGASLARAGKSPAQAEAITRSLAELKGLAMKAGQMLSYVDTAVPPELQEVLKALQQSAQPSPWPQVEAQLRESLGVRADVLLRSLERRPIAVASIGQVHRASLPDGTAVAVKVRHPGIERALEGDFRTAASGTAFASLLLPAGITVDGFVREARTMLLAECDYQLEARRQMQFAELLAGDTTLCIPRVLPEYCGPAVLTTHWLTGQRFESFRASAPAAIRDRAGEALFRFHVGSLYQHGLFHADPHPGNYAFSEDGRVIVYDFGCVREFPHEIVAALARCAEAVRRDDLQSAFAALATVGAIPPQTPEEQQAMRVLLRGFFAPLLTAGRRRFDIGAFASTRNLFEDKRRLARLRLPPEMLFLYRLRFGLFSVLHQLAAEADWAALEQSWALPLFSQARAGEAHLGASNHGA